MPRPKSFDEQKTLARIGQLFWEQGFSATSMDEISAHVGLKKTSIYNAYGDKASLFRASVDWYVGHVISGGTVHLNQNATVSKDIEALLRHFLVEPLASIVSRGCLLTTSLAELQRTEPNLHGYVQMQTRSIQNMLVQYMQNAQAQERLIEDADPVVLGNYIFTLLQGLRTEAREGAEPGVLSETINVAMAPLRLAEPRFARTNV